MQEQPQNPVLSCRHQNIHFAQKKCSTFHFDLIIQHGIVVRRIFKQAKNVVKQETIGIQIFLGGTNNLFVVASFPTAGGNSRIISSTCVSLNSEKVAGKSQALGLQEAESWKL